MTTQEFSNEFDNKLNSYSTIEALGKTPSTVELDEYEKSVFLTNAQEEIVIGMYNGKNPFGDSFERTEEIRRYLSDLIKTYTTTEKKVGYTGLSKSSVGSPYHTGTPADLASSSTISCPNPLYSLNYLMTCGS